MNKKLFILLLLLMFIPTAVYASECNTVSTACLGGIKYSLYSYNDSSEAFKYAAAVRSEDLESGNYFFSPLVFGVKYKGKTIITPDYYIEGLKKARAENKETYSGDEYKDSCIIKKQGNFGISDINTTETVKCYLGRATDEQITEMAVNFANGDWGAVNRMIGAEWTSNKIMELYNDKAHYFSYGDKEDQYKFYYSIEGSDLRCRSSHGGKGNRYTASGTTWAIGKCSFASCPTAKEEAAYVGAVQTEKVSIDWSFKESRWIVTIPELTGLEVKFIRKDHANKYNENDDMDFVHIVGEGAETGYNYDFNDTYCYVNLEENTCNGTNGDDGRYKSVSITKTGNKQVKDPNTGQNVTVPISTVTFSPNAGQTIFYVGSFYLQGGDCNGADIYWHQLSVPEVYDNPYIDDQKAKGICTKYVQEMEKSGYPVSFSYAMVPECNESNKMIDTDSVEGIWTGNTSEYNGYGGSTKVRNKIETVLNKYTNQTINELKVEGNTTCELNFDGDGKSVKVKKLEHNGINTVTYSYTSLLYNDDSHIYWNAFCVEEIVLSYNGPRALSNAGEGFTYPVEVEQKRYCYPYQVKKPTAKPTCSYGIECYGGPAHHTGQAGAGPNEDFDKCIESCDGGEYSQSCINMCYESVYENADTILGLAWVNNPFTKTADSIQCNSNRVEDGGDIGKKFKFTRKIDDTTYSYTTKAPISSCGIITGNGASGNGAICDNYTCTSEHGILFTYLNGCNSRSGTQGTACFEVFTSKTDCLPVNYGGKRTSSAKKLIPDYKNSIFNGVCAEDDMNCYKQISYAEAVDRAEREYQDIIDAISVFKENPASTLNHYKVTLNDTLGTEFEFNTEEYINVKYKRYSEAVKGWSKEYDLNSLNAKVDDTNNYKNYVKTTRTLKENTTFGGNGTNDAALYKDINFGAYSKFYEDYDFKQYKDTNNKPLYEYGLERRYVFNLPDVVVDNKYTTSSNYNYSSAYSYTMLNNKETESVYPNRFMSSYPDYNGLNALDIIEKDESRWYSWKYFYKNGGVSALKNYGDNLDDTDINWNNIVFSYHLGTWNQVSKEEESKQYKDITCFYGIPRCSDSDCVVVCEGGKCETSYIFRPIELTNMFPCNGGNCIDQDDTERNPRLNWSEDAKTLYDNSYYAKQGTYNYPVDPTLVKDSIEQKGSTIYDEDNSAEIDYDLTISKEQIRAIRNYKDGNGKKINFGDYSTMECKKDDSTGMNVCLSTFIRDNDKYVSKTKLGKLGCNNQNGADECE